MATNAIEGIFDVEVNQLGFLARYASETTIVFFMPPRKNTALCVRDIPVLLFNHLERRFTATDVSSLHATFDNPTGLIFLISFYIPGSYSVNFLKKQNSMVMLPGCGCSSRSRHSVNKFFKQLRFFGPILRAEFSRLSASYSSDSSNRAANISFFLTQGTEELQHGFQAAPFWIILKGVH